MTVLKLHDEALHMALSCSADIHAQVDRALSLSLHRQISTELEVPVVMHLRETLLGEICDRLADGQ